MYYFKLLNSRSCSRIQEVLGSSRRRLDVVSILIVARYMSAHSIRDRTNCLHHQELLAELRKTWQVLLDALGLWLVARWVERDLILLYWSKLYLPDMSYQHYRQSVGINARWLSKASPACRSCKSAIAESEASLNWPSWLPNWVKMASQFSKNLQAAVCLTSKNPGLIYSKIDLSLS